MASIDFNALRKLYKAFAAAVDPRSERVKIKTIRTKKSANQPFQENSNNTTSNNTITVRKAISENDQPPANAPAPQSTTVIIASVATQTRSSIAVIMSMLRYRLTGT